VVVAAIAAFVTMAGWFVTDTLAKRRDARLRAQERTARYRQQQIEGLYGPLYSLASQIIVINPA
jgi:hypothetical protein